MRVELTSGTVYTSKVTSRRIYELLTLISMVDNCIEDGDLNALVEEHETIREWMRELGLTPCADRKEEAE